jgi:hypothetical protein
VLHAVYLIVTKKARKAPIMSSLLVSRCLGGKLGVELVVWSLTFHGTKTATYILHFLYSYTWVFQPLTISDGRRNRSP